jgi:hypothetical protein
VTVDDAYYKLSRILTASCDFVLFCFIINLTPLVPLSYLGEGEIEKEGRQPPYDSFQLYSGGQISPHTWERGGFGRGEAPFQTNSLCLIGFQFCCGVFKRGVSPSFSYIPLP